MSKSCPKCGSGSIGDRGLLYYCGNKSTGVYETGKCIKIQRDQLLERIKQLEEAGNEVVYWFSPMAKHQLTLMHLAALNQWNAAKEAKP